MDLQKTKRFTFAKTCPTCGAAVTTHIAPIDFLDRDGIWNPIIEIEGHCGKPGHPMITGMIDRGEFNEI